MYIHFYMDCCCPFFLAAHTKNGTGFKRLFTSKDSFWNEDRNISVDKLKQFLMHEITEAHTLKLGDFKSRNGNVRSDFCIFPHCRAAFFKQICNVARADSFMKEYARLRV